MNFALRLGLVALVWLAVIYFGLYLTLLFLFAGISIAAVV
jgi:hypothetical protein